MGNIKEKISEGFDNDVSAAPETKNKVEEKIDNFKKKLKTAGYIGGGLLASVLPNSAWEKYNAIQNQQIEKGDQFKQELVEGAKKLYDESTANSGPGFKFIANKIKEYKEKNFSVKDKLINAAGKALGTAAIIGGGAGLMHSGNQAASELAHNYDPVYSIAKNSVKEGFKNTGKTALGKVADHALGAPKKTNSDKPASSDFDENLDTSNVKTGDSCPNPTFAPDTTDYKKLAAERKDVPEGWSFKPNTKHFSDNQSEPTFTLY